MVTHRTLAALVTCYLALSLSLGVAQQTWLWARGQHVTSQQASLHERLEQRGLANHHHPAGPGPIPRSPLEPLLPAAQSDLTAAPALSPMGALDGTSCAPALLAVPASPVCAETPPGHLFAPAPPVPALEPPRQPPRLR